MAKKNFTAHLQQASIGQKETETYVKANLVIDEEFRALIPPMGAEELAQLEQNLLAEGVRDPLVVWKGQNVLLDGHNRYAVAQRHGLDFQVVQKEFATREQAKAWMIGNQLGRRNLTPEQQSYLRGKRYENEKQMHGGDRSTAKEASSQNANLKTSELLASEYNVSKDTILRDSKFARGIDLVGTANPALKQAILSGEAKVKKGDLWALADRYADDLSPALSLETVADIRKILAGLSEMANEPLDKPAALPQLSPMQLLVAELKTLLDMVADGKAKRNWPKFQQKLKELEEMIGGDGARV